MMHESSANATNPDTLLHTPNTPIELHIPESPNVVKVSCIDSTARVVLPMSHFMEPDYVGIPSLFAPAFSFLIEHPKRKPILFDLGIRKDWQALPIYPIIVKNNWQIDVKKGIADILKDEGVDLEQVESIIWSHHHFDHVGDPSTFPSSTELVVGPGFTKEFIPGFPANKDSSILETDYEGRYIREVSFTEQGCKIGRFNAIDYFGDGSFYLIETPGHDLGHISGLARTTATSGNQAATFIFMGGDAAHHGGQFRPTQYLPLPKEPRLTTPRGHTPHHICPGHLLQDINPARSPTQPFYEAAASLAHNKDEAQWTLDGLGEFDAHPNILLLCAHDNTAVKNDIPFYPQAINDWFAKDIANQLRWAFLEDFTPAIKAKEEGRAPFSWKNEQK